MADDDNDIEIGVSVNVQTNNASAQVDAEQRKIEAIANASNARTEQAQRASNARQEAEERRHASAMERVSVTGAAPILSQRWLNTSFQQAAKPAYTQPTYQAARPTYAGAQPAELAGARVAAIGSQNDLRAAQQLRIEQATQAASEANAAKIAELQKNGATKRQQINQQSSADQLTAEQKIANDRETAITKNSELEKNGVAKRAQVAQATIDNTKSVEAKIADNKTKADAIAQGTQLKSVTNAAKTQAETDALKLKSTTEAAQSAARNSATVIGLAQKAETEATKAQDIRNQAALRMAQAMGGGYVYSAPNGAKLAPGGGYIGGPQSSVVAPGGGVMPPNAQNPSGVAPPVPPSGGNWNWVPGRGGSGGGSNPLGDFSADFFKNLTAALGQTLQTLQQWLIRLGEVGLKGLIGEVTVAFGAIYKLSESFIKINEQFSNFELTLGSVFKSATDAQKVRQTLTTITGTSPVPFEGLSDLTKMLTVNPMLRPQMVSQVQSGGLNDTNGFLQKNIQLLEEMLAYKPENNSQDAIFSLREAMAGQFRSLTRRFDLPESTISSISGTSRQDLQNDPKKALEAIQKTFAAIIDPSAIKQMAEQPSKLFQNMLEQVFVIPLLTLGHDTQLLATGKNLYDSVLAPFQTMLKSATSFFSPNPNTLQGQGIGTQSDRPESQFQNYAQQMAQPIYSIFTKVFTFLGDTMTKTLSKFGLTVATDPGASIWERISQIVLTTVQGLDKNIEPLMEKARDIITHFFEIFQKLVNAVAGLVDTYGGFIANHPIVSVAVAAAARPAIMMGAKQVGSGVTNFMATAGTGTAVGGIAEMVGMAMPYVLAAVLAAGVVAAIISAVHASNDAHKEDLNAQNEILKAAATSTDPNAKSPVEILQAVQAHTNAVENAQKIQGSVGYDQGTQAAKDAYEAAKQNVTSTAAVLQKLGFDPKTSEVYGYRNSGVNEGEGDPAFNEFKEFVAKWEPVYKIPDTVDARKVNALNSQNITTGQYERTTSSESQYKGLAGLDTTQAGLLAIPNDETNQKMQEAQEKIEGQLNPLKEAGSDIVAVNSSISQILDLANKIPDASGVAADIAKEKVLAEAALAQLKANPVKDTDPVNVDGQQMMYADAKKYVENIIAIDSTLVSAGLQSQQQIDKYATDSNLVKTTLTTAFQNLESIGSTDLKLVLTNAEDFKGTPDQLNTLTDTLRSQLEDLHGLPEQEIDHVIDTIKDNVQLAGQGKGNTDLTQKKKLEDVITQAITDLGVGLSGRFQEMVQNALAKLATADFSSFDIPANLLTGHTDFSSLRNANTVSQVTTPSTTIASTPTWSPDWDQKRSLTLNTGTPDDVSRSSMAQSFIPAPIDNATGSAANSGLIGVNGGDISTSNPLAVTAVTTSGTAITPSTGKWSDGAKQTSGAVTQGIAQATASGALPLPSDPSAPTTGTLTSGAPSYQDWLKSNAANFTGGETQADLQALYQSQIQDASSGKMRTNAPLVAPPSSVAIPPLPPSAVYTDNQGQVADIGQKTNTQIGDQTTAQANKQLDEAIQSLIQILSKAGDTGRGSAEGAVAQTQFNADAAKNPKLQDLLSGMSGSIDSLYTNTKQLGASGLDVTLQKLQTASQIAQQLSQTLATMAQNQPKTPEGQAQALKLQQASNQFAMQAASDQDKIQAQQLSSNPASSFAQGFISKADQPTNYFTDLRTVGVQTAGDISEAFSNCFVGFVNGTTTASQAMSKFAQSILDSIAKIASQRAAESILNLIGQVGGSAIGGLGGSGLSSNAASYSGAGSGYASFVDSNATGGAIIGAGTGTSDSILSWLSNGEHVWTAEEVRKAGGHHTMHQMRRQVRGYAAGGFVSASNPTSAGGYYGGSGSSQSTTNVSISVPMTTGSGGQQLSQAESQRRQRAMADGLQAAVQSEIKRQQRVSGSLYSTRYGNGS